MPTSRILSPAQIQNSDPTITGPAINHQRTDEPPPAAPEMAGTPPTYFSSSRTKKNGFPDGVLRIGKCIFLISFKARIKGFAQRWRNLFLFLEFSKRLFILISCYLAPAIPERRSTIEYKYSSGGIHGVYAEITNPLELELASWRCFLQTGLNPARSKDFQRFGVQKLRKIGPLTFTHGVGQPEESIIQANLRR